MQIDELRDELATLAGEVELFEGDVLALHRSERRRRILTSSVAIGLVAVLGAGALAASRHHDPKKIRITEIPSKEVMPAAITHIDAIVVPATPDVEAALDASPLVGHYARIPAHDRSSNSAPADVQPALCGLQTSDGYAVDAAPAATAVQPSLASALVGRATVFDTSETWGPDFEVFFQVGIATEYPNAVRFNISADPDVQSFQDVTPAEAYEIFKKDFAGQPALVQGTTPADLPESLRVVVTPGRSIDAVVARYEHADGVDTIITFQSALAALFDPAKMIRGSGNLISPCAKPR
jgi:hypothetical protein